MALKRSTLATLIVLAHLAFSQIIAYSNHYILLIIHQNNRPKRRA